MRKFSREHNHCGAVILRTHLGDHLHASQLQRRRVSDHQPRRVRQLLGRFQFRFSGIVGMLLVLFKSKALANQTNPGLGRTELRPKCGVYELMNSFLLRFTWAIMLAALQGFISPQWVFQNIAETFAKITRGLSLTLNLSDVSSCRTNESRTRNNWIMHSRTARLAPKFEFVIL
jgi:hypothetical protein